MPRHRVLIVTQDRVGSEMAGPAIRSIELARSLAREHDVTLLAPEQADYADASFTIASYRGSKQLLQAVECCDIMVASGSLLEKYPAVRRSDRFIVADLYDPAIFEALVVYACTPLRRQAQIHRGALRELATNLRRADVILCASDRQRYLLFGMLTTLGRINPATFGVDPTLEQLVRIVPFGVPPPAGPIARPGMLRTKLRLDDRDLLVLWGGGIYEWLDPLTLVEAAAEMDNSIKIYFLGTDHPTPTTPVMPIGQRAMARAQELGLLNRTVFFGEGWVPYDHRAAYLLDADVGISLHRDFIEATFAFRTRILDYIWAGLPIVASDGDSWASLVRDRGLGEVVMPGDVAGTRRALLRLADEGARSACARSARAVADQFRWDKVVDPLMEFCRHPQRAPDLLDGYQKLRTRVDASERLHKFLWRAQRPVNPSTRREQQDH